MLHSFIGYAPSENPEVIVYTGMKLPKKNLGESSARASSEIFKPVMENTLNYLNVKKNVSTDEIDNYTMENYKGSDLNSTVSKIAEQTENIILIGKGNSIIDQFPSKNNILKKNDKVFLLLSEENIQLPNFIGWSKAEVLSYRLLSGLNIEVEGNGYVKSQSVPAGRIAKKGDNIKIKFS